MRANSSAIHSDAVTATTASGTALAALGVAAFSLTFPATIWGLSGLGAWSLVLCRTSLAGVIAAGVLLARGVRLPDRRLWAGLVIAALGTVIGWPLLTTLALTTDSLAHVAVVGGLLPLTTAVYSALRTGERPPPVFWGAAVAGATVVVWFALQQNRGVPTVGDLYLFAALLLCAAGYSEGAGVARQLPGWQVPCWAVVVCLPLSLPGAVIALLIEPARLDFRVVTGLLWLTVCSQLLGLWLWYRGMAAIGVAKASQLQLAQPLLTLVWSVVLLGEHPTVAAPLAAVAIALCIAATQRARARV